jgi:hypothetical protein
MRILLGVVMLGLSPWLAYAFDPEEHSRLSNDALAAAMTMRPPTREMARKVSEIGPNFGLVTQAVDWFEPPEPLLDLYSLGPTLAKRAARNPKAFLARQWAAHNDATHFQGRALESWRVYHQRALDNAVSDPGLALLAEAVALHYLQDFLAAGHEVTPRAGMHDAAAGQLHDHFNRRGVGFVIRPSDDLSRSVNALVASGARTAAQGLAYGEAVGTDRPDWQGDGALSKNPAGLQATFVAALSTLSITEVFAASVHGQSRGLEPCFSQREAKPFGQQHPRRRPNESDAEYEKRRTKAVRSALPDPNTFAGPEGGVRMVDRGSSVLPAVSPCGDAPLEGRYLTRRDPELTRDDYSLSGMYIRSEAAVGKDSGALRLNVDLLFLLTANDSPGSVTNTETHEPFHGWGLDLKMGSGGPTFLFADRYKAFGLLYDYWLPTRLRGAAWGFRVAPRRYDYTTAQPWRLDAGLQASLGVEVFNLVAAVERGHAVVRDGRFRPDYFASVGADFSFAGGWARRAKRFAARKLHAVFGLGPSPDAVPPP